MCLTLASVRPAIRLLAMAAPALLATALPATAQQQQEWFVPNQGQQQPQQRQQRPAQQNQARQQPQAAATQAPAPLPPGQQPPTAVIGIVDVPEIQRVSTAFTQVRDEIERRRQRLNDDLQREQNNWREQQQQLANQRNAMPQDQLRERERALQDRITDSQRIFRERSRAIEQAAQQALAEIEQGLGGVIRQVAASRKVNLVLPRPLVIFNDPPFDLTEDVAQQFNKVLKSVNMPPESSGTEAPAAANAPARPASPPAQQKR
ncbi:OmpH family outer membrane protein [Roseicella sp. DB1501]|uniref:OmpH family outer membrane protein n=1 Tax=Roseicella sp. DB1501 TaxID=2730925 RepID=UPI0020C249FA|nr:OmpH family outer membrane protein [Roseicella sp. DB1501]